MSSLVARTQTHCCYLCCFFAICCWKVQFTENERSKCERWKMKDFDWIAGQMCRHGSFLSTLNCSICIIFVVVNVDVVVERKKVQVKYWIKFDEKGVDYWILIDSGRENSYFAVVLRAEASHWRSFDSISIYTTVLSYNANNSILNSIMHYWMQSITNFEVSDGDALVIRCCHQHTKNIRVKKNPQFTWCFVLYYYCK